MLTYGPYRAGILAWRTGERLIDNPHPRNSDPARQWEQGWYAAHWAKYAAEGSVTQRGAAQAIEDSDREALNAYVQAVDERVKHWSVADQEAFAKATRGL